MNILLGLTGSVATTLAPKLIAALESIQNCDEVRVVMTEKAQMFQSQESLARISKVKIYTERDEWTWFQANHLVSDKWQKGDPILHIELARWASIIVIAPCTANTIFKLAYGQTDNLLTSIFTARNAYTPIIIAPSMNERMWLNTANQNNLIELKWNEQIHIVPPVLKELACGEIGLGALANIQDIAKVVEETAKWHFPIPNHHCPGIPVKNHPGAFGAFRKHDRHCGVDLYCPEGTPVLAVEDGEIIIVEPFTGEKAGCPWWLDTMAVKVAGPSGTICYGEIIPDPSFIVGSMVHKGERLGKVTPVLKPGKERPDIPGHSRSMLHLQMYTRGTTYRDDNWTQEGKLPDNIIDPTSMLLSSDGCPEPMDMPDYIIKEIK